MVRLVFRPYTQVLTPICTLGRLRASIRVSPDFTLLRHSSPSFGSYSICSHSNPSSWVGRCWSLRRAPFTFISRMSFSTRTLAYKIDSLVRVSRRDCKNHFGKITLVPQAVRTLSGLTLFWFVQPHFARSFGRNFRTVHPVAPSWDPSVFTASFSTISDLFTLFSKSFSSFLHSTCLLSVSHPYLALEESYLPLRAAVPSNPTLLGLPLLERRLHGAFTLFGPLFEVIESTFVFRVAWLQFGSSLNSRFQFRAFAGSVALTKAIFVNFFSSA